MAKATSFNLFIYGTLTNPWVFRAVLGKHLTTDPHTVHADDRVLAREAVLTGYKKVSPDHTYLYAVPSPHGRIQGYIVGPLPVSDLKPLRRYEGRNYRRRTMPVQTAAGTEKAMVFIADTKKIELAFGYSFADPLKQEVLLGEKIDAALAETELRQLKTSKATVRRAVAELHGTTIRDLVRQHFDAGGISDYAIRHSLQDRPLPDFSVAARQENAAAIAGHYLGMILRQVIFNEFEERIQREFRYELEQMRSGPEYYGRTVSSLAALRVLNESASFVYLLVHDCMAETNFAASHLVDYVRWAVTAADVIFNPDDIKPHIAFIREHMGGGHIPLGAELEFSNIGNAVISDPQSHNARDAQYDGFFYFGDFALDALTWKLGGHVDDHREKAPGRQRRGFFEAALGNVSITENLSQPLTHDPWLLNQLIQETMMFFAVKPHSLHISLQLRRQHRPVRDRLLPLDVFKCLFALVGDLAADSDGRLRISRLADGEIVGSNLPTGADKSTTPHMLFSDISRRRSSPGGTGRHDGVATPDAGGRYVQQFKFMRLAPRFNYETIAMALKGIQITYCPGTFLTAEQYQTSRRHRRVHDELTAWAQRPTALSADEVNVFIEAVHDGLMTERRGKPAHTTAYIAWACTRLRESLRQFNSAVHRAAVPVHNP
ncbi:MAG: gamma-glutamylcyclotransferase family protein [Planctomycetaceae bacterium]|nr:gamma-glutamylcyclotransferase [Planctomycetaceae bacterium]